MIMTLNEILTKQNVITKIELVKGMRELPKELKVKIMRWRMAYNKVRNQFEADLKEFREQLLTDELQELANMAERTPEQEERFKGLEDAANQEYAEFVNQKGLEEISLDINDKLTEDEYMDIVDINAGNDVVINGVEIKAPDFLEAVYNLYVTE